MSDMPEQQASTDVHRDLGHTPPATFEDLREELRALSALVHEQQRALEQIGAVESEAVALTRSLPDRLGSAIAAAIETRQASFLLESERAASSLKASLRDLGAHSEALATRVDDRRSEITDAAARVLESSEHVGAVADRTRAELQRLEERIAELPDVTGAVVDDRIMELRERLTRLSEQLERQDGPDIATELRARMEQVRAGLLEAVRVGVGQELAAAVHTLTDRIDDAASSAAPPSAAELDRIGEQVIAGLAPALDELRQSISVLLGKEDPAVELRERIADLASQLQAVEERLAARVQTTDRADELERGLDELAVRLGSAIDQGIEGVHQQVVEAHEPLDDLHASVQRLAAVIRELATRDETAVTVRLDAISQRIADLSVRPDAADPTDALNHLASRIDELAQLPKQLASPDDLRAVRDHVAGARIAGEQSAEVASVMAQRVDDRLDELAARIAGLPHGGSAEPLDRLEARVDDLAATLDEVAAAVKKLRRPPLRAKRKPAGGKKQA